MEQKNLEGQQIFFYKKQLTYLFFNVMRNKIPWLHLQDGIDFPLLFSPLLSSRQA